MIKTNGYSEAANAQPAGAQQKNAQQNDSKQDIVLSVRGLKMYFPGPRRSIWPWSKRSVIKAVDDVSFEIRRGQTLGLVGESGSGKSTLARCVLQLHRPTAGEVIFENRDLCRLSNEELRSVRPKAQIIFQDPYASLDPRRSIGYTIGEPLLLTGMKDPRQRRERVAELLRLVGLNPFYENRYPHELSGGQRQRVGTARALATDPTFVVADEPVSALDVSIQAQVINLLRELQGRLGLTFLFISHDLRVVRYISDQVAVMYLGRIVEIAPTEQLYQNPLHPYTRSLLSAVPKPRWETGGVQPIKLEGEVPSPIDPPPGCHFAPRCPFAQPRCSEARPSLDEVEPDHKVACFLVDNFR
jgi:oligopeptide transport system ATP-binding protein